MPSTEVDVTGDDTGDRLRDALQLCELQYRSAAEYRPEEEIEQAITRFEEKEEDFLTEMLEELSTVQEAVEKMKEAGEAVRDGITDDTYTVNQREHDEETYIEQSHAAAHAFSDASYSLDDYYTHKECREILRDAAESDGFHAAVENSREHVENGETVFLGVYIDPDSLVAEPSEEHGARLEAGEDADALIIAGNEETYTAECSELAETYAALAEEVAGSRHGQSDAPQRGMYG